MPNNQFIIRLILPNDYYCGFFEILSQLTTVVKPTYESFVDYLNIIPNNTNTYVIENTENSQIIGTGRILIEHKFIHNLATKCYIEDIVIDEKYRNNGLGKQLIDFLTNECMTFNPYKISLVCSDNKIEFYEKCGFKKSGLHMSMYI